MTYTLMTLPMAVFSLYTWLNNPFEGNKSQVSISRLEASDWLRLALLTSGVTFVFYFILAYFNTAYLLVSTFSVASSFAAVYLSYRRSPFFALAYVLNDVILILLWLYAAQTDISQYALVICFSTFLINDIHTFINWLKLRAMQEKHRLQQRVTI
ncbi:nicotinamide mononucleotide transporter [Streptococcus ictaluri 707-05]|uniref:Nicotinamide mononucleotide transporter n=1 Tax=Streptococcus ictaluri 707-05 TaxID=764299 RepID=G5K666_9STRE|nr:nicotinamide mononucleotide transporter [Streptococcus ictaluri 707-05]